MLKLTPCAFARPSLSIKHPVQLRPLGFLFALAAYLVTFQFPGFVEGQLSTDSIEGDFVSVFGAESDLNWTPHLGEAAFVEVGLADSDCCPETLEPAALEENRSICTIKCALGGTETVAIRPEDELWIVSARNISECRAGAGSLEVKRLASKSWQAASMDELANCHRTNTPLTTLVYAHGNQTDYDFGISRGVQFYRNLASCKELNGPIRMVLWLWKSEKESVRLYKDFRTKSKRAVEMGAALQTTLERLGDSRVALVGFSLGAQVILSALDSMEEQQACSFDGWDWSRSQGCLGCDSGYREKYKVALIAPALDPAYACAAADRTVCSSLVDQTRVFNNRSDRAVKALRVIIRRECPQKSISFKKLVDEQRLYLGQVKHVDLSSEVGHRHSIVRYSRTESLCCELGNLVSDIFSEKIFANQPVPNNQIAVE